jgi:hypothetical protein
MAFGRRTPPEKVEEIKALSVAFDAKTIAEKTGTPLRTVYDILKRNADSPAIKQERAQRAEKMRDDIWASAKETVEAEIAKLAEKCDMLLDHMTPEKAAKARVSEIATSFGILTDKKRLLQGESTSNEARHVRVVVVHQDGSRKPVEAARSSATQEAREVQNPGEGQTLENSQESHTDNDGSEPGREDLIL